MRCKRLPQPTPYFIRADVAARDMHVHTLTVPWHKAKHASKKFKQGRFYTRQGAAAAPWRVTHCVSRQSRTEAHAKDMLPCDLPIK